MKPLEGEMCAQCSQQPSKWESEFEKNFIDIMGLETDPHGKENMYLIYDEDHVVQYGIDFADEMKELKSFIRTLLSDTAPL